MTHSNQYLYAHIHMMHAVIKIRSTLMDDVHVTMSKFGTKIISKDVYRYIVQTRAPANITCFFKVALATFGGYGAFLSNLINGRPQADLT